MVLKDDFNNFIEILRFTRYNRAVCDKKGRQYMMLKEVICRKVMIDGKISKKRMTLLVTGIAGVVILAVYIVLSLYFIKHFAFRTTLNGIQISGESVERVEEKLVKRADNYELTFQERGGQTEVMKGSEVSLAPVFDGEVERLLEMQNGFAWPYYLFVPNQLEEETMLSYDDERLDKKLAELKCMNRKDWSKSQNAKILNYTKDGYEIEEAFYGTAIDTDAMREEVISAMENLQQELDMEKTGCYQDPEVTEEDTVFADALDTLNRYTGIRITYDVGEDEEVLAGETISTWLSVNEDYEVVIDEEAVLDYVKTLAKKYNTIYGNRTLETSYGQSVTIYGGDYGWWIDNEAECDMIIEDMKQGDDVEREPLYKQTANSRGAYDYGDTYVEINLTAQHLFFYKDGKLLVESDLVSGNLAKQHGTPSGSYALTYKTRDAVLRGEDYETPVSYWMPFNGGVGMHDATWRGTFGGSIYKRNGSHGCVNLPYGVAQKIYENIEAGYPVLVYELPGTESPLGIAQDAAYEMDKAIEAIGTVTLDSAAVIQSLRVRYDALSDTAKTYVRRLDILTAAETALAQLQAAAEEDKNETDTEIPQ